MSAESNQSVRPARQAGRFYDADQARLRREVQSLLQDEAPVALERPPVALVAPHAGYAYSGRIAAAAFRQVAGRAVDRVLLLGPSHYRDFTGGALSSATAFATPLGEVPLDCEAAAELAEQPGFELLEEAHDPEHAIEVQLPFLQVAFEKPFLLLPIALGRISHTQGLALLREPLLDFLRRRIAAGQTWLIIASSDTYHGYDPEACAANDQRLSALLERVDGAAIAAGALARSVMACGWLPLALTVELAQGLGAGQGIVLKRSDSHGGASREGDYVVGYIAAAFV